MMGSHGDETAWQTLHALIVCGLLSATGLKLDNDGSVWPARNAQPQLPLRKDQPLHSGDMSAFQVVSGKMSTGHNAVPCHLQSQRLQWQAYTIAVPRLLCH